MTRIAHRAGRTTLVRDGVHHDLAAVSGGRLPADLQALYDGWEHFRAWDPATADSSVAPVGAAVAWDAPATRAAQVLAVGLNHPAKIAAYGVTTPTSVGIIVKASSALAGPVAQLELTGPQVYAEVELAVVIGRPAHRITREDALAHVAGVTVALDLADVGGFVRLAPTTPGGRTVTYADPAKSSPGFAPLGPELVTLDELGDLDDLRLTLDVDGIRVQDGTPADFVFGVEQIVADLSRRITLRPGDVILTGSPGQVEGRPLTPLLPGNVLVAEIAGVGRQEHVVVAAATREG